MKSLPFQKNRLLKELTTFGIGGPAKYWLEVRSISEMQNGLILCRENNLPYLILGKGSNCLFDDQGFNGVIFVNKIDFFEQPIPGTFHIGAGYSFSLLGSQTARQEWSGLEFASGIPGSVGGAVFMNAGANGRETCESLTSVDFVDDYGNLKHINKDELSFSYRHSSFQTMPGAIVGATFTLTPNATARAKQLEIIAYRTKTQPYGQMSAGCIFKNPTCGHAGALIEQSGLKGISIGDAQVSTLHANFIVNKGSATAEDVHALIAHIKKEVKAKTNIDLESEVRYMAW